MSFSTGLPTISSFGNPSARFSFEVDPDQHKKLFATFNVSLNCSVADRVCLTFVSGASALEVGRVERKERKRLCSLAPRPTPSFLHVVTRLPQDDFCIQLSKNVEPDERRQAFPSFATDAAAQAASTAARASASSNPSPVTPIIAARAAAVALPAATVSASAVAAAPPPSASAAASQPLPSSGAEAVGSVVAGPAAAVTAENAASLGSGDAHSEAPQVKEALPS